MNSPLTLTETARTVWDTLRDGPLDISQIVSRTGLDQSQVTVVAQEAQAAGFATIQEVARIQVDPNPDAANILATGLAERRALEWLVNADGSMPLEAFVQACKQAEIPVNEVFRWGSARGWIERVKSPPCVRMTSSARDAIGTIQPDELAVKLAIEGTSFLDDQVGRGVDIDAAQKLLASRSELAKLRKRTQRIVTLTDTGRQALQQAKLTREQNALSPQDLQNGSWKSISLRPYDITLPGKTIYPAKIHPLRKIIEQARRAFLELGFQEVVSPMIESAFWNFDALFQPQDHPARDMQDTFYLGDPCCAELPDDHLVQAVRCTHEDGGKTGSTGWGYKWSNKTARQLVLRTHTTAATIRALASHPNPPVKAFCVGWTFRNETISFKHLPVFHQLDGIIVDEHASLATLLGTLSAFYQKMGFEKVRFKPAFYPYTEPSVDVMVYMESRGAWIEMGGSGIFRPEVTEPLGCHHPTLAWGLGVERLAMLRLGLTDIRQLYQGGLDDMEEVALCR